MNYNWKLNENISTIAHNFRTRFFVSIYLFSSGSRQLSWIWFFVIFFFFPYSFLCRRAEERGGTRLWRLDEEASLEENTISLSGDPLLAGCVLDDRLYLVRRDRTDAHEGILEIRANFSCRLPVTSLQLAAQTPAYVTLARHCALLAWTKIMKL